MEDEDEKKIKQHSRLIKTKNTNYLNDNINNDQQLNVQFIEIAHKNSEPKDNIKKANHRRLMNSGNQINLLLDSELKIKENYLKLF